MARVSGANLKCSGMRRLDLNGQGFPGTAPFGSELVILDEIADFDKVQISTVLNGEVIQSATLDHIALNRPSWEGVVKASSRSISG